MGPFGLPLATARQLGVCLAVLVGFCIGTVALWNRHIDQVAQDQNFLLSAAEIRVTDRPDWIQSDVRAEAIAIGGLDESIDIRDRRLTDRVAESFAAHPWVRRVHRVAKQYPAKVTVQLEYREPVAMVEVLFGDNRRGLIPIDSEGVVLPTDDFAPSRAVKYPRIQVGLQATSSAPGQKWGDDRVAEAAAIAHLLGAHWEALKLARISLGEDSPAAERAYILETMAGDRVIWGSAPGRELPHETLAAQKVAVMLEATAENVVSQEPPADQLDLRTAGRGITAAAPATRR